MKLRMTDQLHISSVSKDTLAPGMEIEVSDSLGNELLKKHPDKVEQIKEKAERKPRNKAEKPDANK
ncbi:hypothetical protein [Bradyrhizobium liaoningense]|uniref:hypothetical protein n=1 Tax=Bradyrhizobium liaoningense TaxID=43992 RepID=UPI001BA7445F|nr:hypothetical protein [Bradyrhizobium liaoningense]MBR0855659.1 hypothetical protein [Bradyrhizobium liaoningense]